MKSTDHGTWTEYTWEKGDLVRLRKPGSRIMHSFDLPAGEFGLVVDDRDGYHVGISLHGYSRGIDSVAAHATMSRYDLEPWVREPRDEPAILRNVVETLRRLAWTTNARTGQVSGGRIEIVGDGINAMRGRSGFRIALAVLETALPYLGDGTGRADDPHGIDWTPNAAAHDLLDHEGCHASISLPGGGNAFDLAYDRRGVFTIRDLGTGLAGSFEGDDALRLLEANRTEVGILHDGRMPEIARRHLAYPRSLRNEPWNGLAVVEIDEVAVEVRRGGETVGRADGAEAHEIRRACRRISDLPAWFDRHPDLLGSASSSAPSFR